MANREQCPAIPYTPEEYAAEAKRAVDEGCSMIHIHARTPDGVPSYEVEDFRAITEAIRGAVDDVIINYSTGAIGIPIQKRIEYLRELRPDVAALNMGSMNYAKYSSKRKDFVFKTVFENSFDTIIEFVTVMNELGIRPEHECFDSGHVANLDPLIDMGLVSEPLQVSCVMGVTGGIRPTAKNLAHMAEQVPDVRSNWGVIGISRDQWRLIAAAVALGGNVRAGLEDNFYLPDGEMAGSNGELIAKAREIVENAGRRAATVDGGARAARRMSALEDVRVLDLSQAAARWLLLPAAGRLRRRGAEGRGHGDGRLHPLVAALPRGRRGQREVRALPCAEPRQALDSAGPEERGRQGGSPAAGPGVRRAARVLPPGVMERLGVGYERLREENPRLVYCAISGYGQDGPYTARSGHDMNYLGLNGLLGLTGEPDGPPVQSAGQIADLGGGALMAAFGIMAALRERERSGEGQLVDVSMFDGSLSWLAMVAAQYLADGAVPRRGTLPLAGGLICYRPYACRDGWVTLGALEPKFWQAWCRGVGREDLVEKQFEGPGSDAHAEVERVFLERTREEWQAFASEHDCCLEPVLDLDEALDSELVRAREMVVELDQPGADSPVRLLGVPVKLSRTPGSRPDQARARRAHARGADVARLLRGGDRRAAGVGGGGGAAPGLQGDFRA